MFLLSFSAMLDLYRGSTMDTGDVYLKLDKQWDMQDIAQLSKLYIQCYSLVHSLSNVDKREYIKYPWKGGYSAVNFYNNLYYEIPHEERPAIQEIHYASPGYIKLKEALVVAALVAGIVATVTNSIDDIQETYDKIQRGISDRKLMKIDVQIKYLQLKEAELEFIRESKNELIEKMQIPEIMQPELSILSKENELMELKILMSFHRRVKPLAIMQAKEMLLVEELSTEKYNK